MESKIPLVQAPGGGLGPLPPGPRLEGRRGARRSGRGAAGAGGALGELRALTAAGGKGRMWVAGKSVENVVDSVFFVICV